MKQLDEKPLESNQMTKRISIILLICIGLRLIFFLIVRPWNPEVEKYAIIVRDGRVYHELASTLLETGRFAKSSASPPEVLRTPLYPAFIALNYWLFGHKPYSVMLFQIVIDTLSCFLLFMMLSRLFDAKVAALCSLFYAVDPFLILYSSRLVSEIVFVFFFIAGFYFLSYVIIAKRDRKALINCGIAGLILGLATWMRVIIMYIPFIIIVFFVVCFWRKPKVYVKYIVVVLLFFGLAISPWLIRNYVIFDRFSFSTSGSFNLLALYVVPMETPIRNKDKHDVRRELLTEAEKMILADGLDPEKMNEFQRAEYWKRLALKYIKKDPVSFVKVYLLGVIHTFINLESSTYAVMLGKPRQQVDVKAYTNIFDLVKAFISHKSGIELFIAGFVFLYVLFSYISLGIGLLVSWKKYDWRALLLLLLISAYFILVTGAAGLARFRLPAIPFYLPFVVTGIMYLYEKSISRNK